MLTIKVNLNNAVGDLTQAVRAKIFPRYFSRQFDKTEFNIKVMLDNVTSKTFNLYITLIPGNGDEADRVISRLSADNGLSVWPSVFECNYAVTQYMTVEQAVLCACHVSGDYIKFAYSLESED